MAQRRKYKFNWLDYLYYTGKGGPAQWSMWFYIECFFVLPPLILLLLCPVVMVREQTVNSVLVTLSVCSACTLAVVLFSKRLLEKRRFTLQRERAYFLRYPGRKISRMRNWRFYRFRDLLSCLKADMLLIHFL